MKSRHPLVWVMGFTALLVNPAVACGPSNTEDNFAYGETEMVAAVQGTWQLTFSTPDGATNAVTFTLEKGVTPNGALAAPPGLAPQCGTRTFVRSAAACIASSELVLAAHVVDATPPLDSDEGTGTFSVLGLQYTGGALEVKFGASLSVSATLDPDNSIRSSAVMVPGGITTFVLTRVVN